MCAPKTSNDLAWHGQSIHYNFDPVSKLPIQRHFSVENKFTFSFFSKKISKSHFKTLQKIRRLNFVPKSFGIRFVKFRYLSRFGVVLTSK